MLFVPGVHRRYRVKTSDFLADGAEFGSWMLALHWFQADEFDRDH